MQATWKQLFIIHSKEKWLPFIQLDTKKIIYHTVLSGAKYSKENSGNMEVSQELIESATVVILVFRSTILIPCPVSWGYCALGNSGSQVSSGQGTCPSLSLESIRASFQTTMEACKKFSLIKHQLYKWEVRERLV